MKVLLFSFIIFPSLVYAQCIIKDRLPDASCTLGDVLNVTTKQVCEVGYTKTVRNVPLSERKQVFSEYGIKDNFGSYEVDHYISLELGGSNDIKNLWPESYSNPNGARVKDQVENYLHRQVCSGNITLQEAQKEISTDWMDVYKRIHS